MNNQNLNRRLREINELEKILEKERQKLIREKMNLQNKCPHTIVIAVSDKRAHKVGPIHTYQCPICEKIIHTHYPYDIDKKLFINSKIINLTNLNYEEYDDLFKSIINEILSNYNYYYNPDISSEELSETITEKLKQIQKIERDRVLTRRKL